MFKHQINLNYFFVNKKSRLSGRDNYYLFGINYAQQNPCELYSMPRLL